MQTKSKTQQLEKLSLELGSVLSNNHSIVHALCEQANYITAQLLGEPHSLSPQSTAIQHKSDDERVEMLTERLEESLNENEELRKTLDIVMTKYREQARGLVEQKQQFRKEMEHLLQQENRENESLREENTLLQQKLEHMLHVIKRAAEAEPDEMNDRILVESLIKENQGLKEMLAIQEHNRN